MPQTTSLIGTQFVQRGKKFAMMTNRQPGWQTCVAAPPLKRN